MAASPNLAVLLAALGILLIYIELNRPGMILPGAIGLLAVLVSVGALLRQPLRTSSALVVMVCLISQASFYRTHLSWPFVAALAFCLFGGFWYLLNPNGTQISLPTALTAALILGPGTSMLTAIARRARQNKGLDS